MSLDDGKAKYDKPLSCIGCPAERLGIGYVSGYGPSHAKPKYIYIGQGPGRDECYETGRPFTGGSGSVQIRLSGECGIGWTETYKDNAIRCHLPGDAKPSKAVVDYCTKRHLGPALLAFPDATKIALGSSAAYFLTGNEAVEEQRGQMKDHPTYGRYTITFHPAFLMRKQNFFPLAQQDLKMAVADKSGLHNPYILQTGAYLPFPTEEQVIQYAAFVPGAAVDLETNMRLDPLEAGSKIELCGFANLLNPTQAICIPWQEKYLGSIRSVLADSERMKVMHNRNFDQYWLETAGYIVNGRVDDTMVMSHLLDSSLPNKLEFTASYHLGTKPWKREYKRGKESREVYNCKDTHHTAALHPVMLAKIRAEGMETLHNTLSAVGHVLVRTRLAGAYVDNAEMLKWNVALRKMIIRAEAELQKGLNQPWFNWRSPQQLSKLLYGKMQLPIQLDHKSKQPTTNKEALQKLAEDHPKSTILKLLMNLRTWDKMRGTYTTLQLDAEGKVHSEVLCTGTVSGRTATRDPNLANQPKAIRQIFCAPPGHLLFSADYKQFELLIALALAGEDEWYEKILAGHDVHREFAAIAYSKAISAVTDLERHYAKYFIYGVFYGRGLRSIARQWKKPLSVAEKWDRAFRQAFPKAFAWFNGNVTEAQLSGVLRNPYGRRMRIQFSSSREERGEHSPRGQALAFVPQSTAADILYSQSVLLFTKQVQSFARPFTWVYDDTVGYVQEDKVQLLQAAVKDILEAKLPALGNRHVPIDFQVGRNWGKFHEKTNPNGLRKVT